MRKTVALAILMFAMTLTAQENHTSVSNLTEVSENLSSKSIIGVWKQTGMLNRYTGEYDSLRSDIYKVINADGTYFIVVALDNHKNNAKKTAIISHGTYELTSDNTFVESISKEPISSTLRSKKSVEFDLIDDNSMTLALAKDKGMSGKWTRSANPLNEIAFENLKNQFANTNDRTLIVSID